jgi:hypothetical protein
MFEIAISVDEQILRKVGMIAADRNTSVAELIRGYLARLAREEDTLQRQLALQELEGSFQQFSRDMGPRNWSREDLCGR